MLSKNNRQEQFRKQEPKKQRFAIKKLTVGVASVLIGFTFMGLNASASADEVQSDSDANAHSAASAQASNDTSATSTALKASAAADSSAVAPSAAPASQSTAADAFEKAVASNTAEAEKAAASSNVQSDAPAASSDVDTNAVLESVAAEKTTANSSVNTAFRAAQNDSQPGKQYDVVDGVATVDGFYGLSKALVNKDVTQIDFTNNIDLTNMTTEEADAPKGVWTGGTSSLGNYNNSGLSQYELGLGNGKLLNHDFDGIARALTINGNGHTLNMGKWFFSFWDENYKDGKTWDLKIANLNLETNGTTKGYGPFHFYVKNQKNADNTNLTFENVTADVKNASLVDNYGAGVDKVNVTFAGNNKVTNILPGSGYSAVVAKNVTFADNSKLNLNVTNPSVKADAKGNMEGNNAFYIGTSNERTATLENSSDNGNFTVGKNAKITFNDGLVTLDKDGNITSDQRKDGVAHNMRFMYNVNSQGGNVVLEDGADVNLYMGTGHSVAIHAGNLQVDKNATLNINTLQDNNGDNSALAPVGSSATQTHDGFHWAPISLDVKDTQIGDTDVNNSRTKEAVINGTVKIVRGVKGEDIKTISPLISIGSSSSNEKATFNMTVGKGATLDLQDSANSSYDSNAYNKAMNWIGSKGEVNAVGLIAMWGTGSKDTLTFDSPQYVNLQRLGSQVGNTLRLEGINNQVVVNTEDDNAKGIPLAQWNGSNSSETPDEAWRIKELESQSAGGTSFSNFLPAGAAAGDKRGTYFDGSGFLKKDYFGTPFDKSNGTAVMAPFQGDYKYVNGSYQGDSMAGVYGVGLTQLTNDFNWWSPRRITLGENGKIVINDATNYEPETQAINKTTNDKVSDFTKKDLQDGIKDLKGSDNQVAQDHATILGDDSLIDWDNSSWGLDWTKTDFTEDGKLRKDTSATLTTAQQNVYNALKKIASVTPATNEDGTLKVKTSGTGDAFNGQVATIVYKDSTADHPSVDFVLVPVNVTEAQANEYQPEYNSVSVTPGGKAVEVTPTWSDKDGNKGEPADGATFTSVTTGDKTTPDWATVADDGTVTLQPDKDVTPGHYEVPVEVTYKDGSKETVNVPVSVNKTDPNKGEDTYYGNDTMTRFEAPVVSYHKTSTDYTPSAAASGFNKITFFSNWDGEGYNETNYKAKKVYNLSADGKTFVNAADPKDTFAASDITYTWQTGLNGVSEPNTNVSSFENGAADTTYSFPGNVNSAEQTKQGESLPGNSKWRFIYTVNADAASKIGVRANSGSWTNAYFNFYGATGKNDIKVNYGDQVPTGKDVKQYLASNSLDGKTFVNGTVTKVDWAKDGMPGQDGKFNDADVKGTIEFTFSDGSTLDVPVSFVANNVPVPYQPGQDGVDDNMNKYVTRTITVKEPGKEPVEVKQTVHFTNVDANGNSGYKDADGKITYNANWHLDGDLNATTGTWDKYTAPEVKGYTADPAEVAAKTDVTVETQSETVTIEYHKSSDTPVKYDPADDNMNKYVTRTITVKEPGKEPVEVKQTVHFTNVDANGNSGYKDPETDEVKYNTNWHLDGDLNAITGTWDKYTAPEVKGYTADPAEVAAKTVNAETPSESVTVEYHKSSDTPVKYDPADDNMNKYVTRTITVKEPGKEPVEVKQTVHFTNVDANGNSGYKDADGKITYNANWHLDGNQNATTGTWDKYTAPEVKGYTADPAEVAAKTVNAETPNTNVTVAYNVNAPKGQNVKTNLNEEPNAEDAISNKDNLPDGTKYEWKTPVDVTTVGDKPATVVVTYPGGQTAEVPVTVTVTDNRSEADKYTPEGQDVNTTIGVVPDAKDGIENVKDLPANATYTWKTTPDVSKPGTVDATVVVTYNDGSKDEVPVHVIVSETSVPYDPADENMNKKVTRTITVYNTDGTTKTIEQTVHFVRGGEGQVAGTKDENGKITWTDWTVADENNKSTGAKAGSWAEFDVPQVDGYTSTVDGKDAKVVAGNDNVTPDTKTANVTVAYTKTSQPTDPSINPNNPGENSDMFVNPTRTINVTNPVNGKTDTTTQTVWFGRTKTVSTDPNALVKYGDWQLGKVDGDTFVADDKAPNVWPAYTAPAIKGYTSVVEGNTAEVKVTPDTNDETVNVTYDVNAPKGQNITVDKGDNPAASTAISNTDDLPDGTKYEWKTPVDTTTPGEKPATVVVTYPGGKTTEVPVTVTVNPTDADKYTADGGNITVDKGHTLTDGDAENAIVNHNDLPDATKYTWKTPVDTSTIGDKTGVVIVTYPDGSVDEAPVMVHVIDDAAKYDPQGQDVTIKKGDPVPDAKDGIENTGDLPSDTKYEWEVAPDPSKVGKQPVVITVTYPDGSQDKVPTTVIVTDNATTPDKTDAEKYTPEGQVVNVDKGHKLPDASEGIKNKDEMPEGTTYTWKNDVDTNTPGDKPAVITVHYPDGSTEDVPTIVHVNPSQADENTPNGQNITVEKDAPVPDASTAITNKDDLPKGTKYTWETTPDTSKVGDQPATVVVTYPDGSKDTVPVVVTVKNPAQPQKTDAEKYNPQGGTINAKLGDDLTNDTPNGITNKDDLPNGTKYTWTDGTPSTTESGLTMHYVTVNYPDGSSEVVPVYVNVTSQADKYTPEPQVVTVDKGQTPNPGDGIKNRGDLPDGTKYDWKNPVDTTTPGDKSVTVVVTYPDGSKDEVPTVVHVKTDAESNEPEGQTVDTTKGQVPNADKGIKNLDDLPEGTKTDWTNPDKVKEDVNTIGQHDEEITVTYPDGSKDTITVTVDVKTPADTNGEGTDAEKYDPQPQPITTPEGVLPDASEGIKNKDDMPEGTKYTWKDEGKVKEDIKTPGTHTETIVVTFPDGTTLDRDVDVTVPAPEGQDINTDQGQLPNPADAIKNKGDMPDGTKYTWKQEPDVTTPGDHTGIVEVTFPDGTTYEVTVNVHVNAVNNNANADNGNGNATAPQADNNTTVTNKVAAPANNNKQSANTTKQLPQTGNEANETASLVGLGLASVASLFGLGGLRKKKEADK